MATDYGKIAAFLHEIGLTILEEPLPEKTFVPGIAIRQGVLVVDPVQLRFPGDLLHEGGHLAIMTPAERKEASGTLEVGLGPEMAADAWAWAAALHLDLPPDVVFHSGGYQGHAPSLIENFSQGRYVGVPLLDWYGLTQYDMRAPQTPGSYPIMRSWIRS